MNERTRKYRVSPTFDWITIMKFGFTVGSGSGFLEYESGRAMKVP
jgi:hypothetical protein